MLYISSLIVNNPRVSGIQKYSSNPPEHDKKLHADNRQIRKVMIVVGRNAAWKGNIAIYSFLKCLRNISENFLMRMFIDGD